MIVISVTLLVPTPKLNAPTSPPSDFSLHLDPSVRKVPGTDGTTVLVGGSPFKLLRLRPAALAVLGSLTSGCPVSQVSGAQRDAVVHLAYRLIDAGMAHPRYVGASRYDTRDVTVVIPAKDRAAELERLFQSLDPTMPVIVVDDGSTDVTSEVALAHQARVVRHSLPRGPAAARNAGLELVTTPLVAFLDSDAEATPGWLDTVLPHFNEPTIALVAPRIVGPQQEQQQQEHPTQKHHRSVLARYLDARSPLDLGPNEGRVAPKTRIAYVPAVALVGRVARLRAVGGFDEAMQVGEDVDLVWRIVRGGSTVRYEPSSLVRHHHLVHIGDFLRRHAQYGESAAVLSRRHPGQVPAVSVSSWSAAAWAAIASQTAIGLVGGLGIAGVSIGLFPKKLTFVGHPWREAVALAGRGHVGAGRLLASAVTRAWFPLAIGSALVSKRARRVAIVAAVVPPLMERRHRRPALDPVRWTALSIADDAAYCVGVWKGSWSQRSLAALRPDFTAGRV